jgi:cysteine-rich repeat protein
MRISVWVLLAATCAAGTASARAVDTCESVSAGYVTAVITGARSCLTLLAPRGRSCASRNRTPNLMATRVNLRCAPGTVERLACSARQAIMATGLPYQSLSPTGFAHLCTSAACGNGVTEPGEECDDSNLLNGDGCSATCQFESNSCSDICSGIVPVAGTAIRAVRVASGLSSPVLVSAPSGDVSRIFIVEQTGAIRIVKWGTLLPAAFLDIHAQISSGGERGLLGLAFHPHYASNGRFFVDYTDVSGNTVISQYQVSADPDVAATTETVLLQVTQPFSNHNGGHLAFGPDGYLYIALGDGGSGGDPQGNGQNITTLLGKLLRIDVDGTPPYTSPATNPFFGATPGRDEIWAYGLRNPWRFSFDRSAGDLYIGDVGQNRFEEVDFQPVGSAGGKNYGWNVVEGDGHCYPSGTGCDQTGTTPPVLDYDHSQGCSITGGYVYRGCAMPDLRGTYFYGDYCSAFIRSLRIVGGVATQRQDHTAELAPDGGLAINSISSFGEDARGEIYICDLGGEVFKIVPSL